MGKIRDGIDGLTERFDRLGPVVKLGLEEAFRQKSEPDRTWDGLLKDMAQLREIADRFGSAKFVRKQRDEILKQAVGGLMLLLEMLTGNRAFGRRANSVTGSPPELVNAEARAIASLLRVTEPRLPDTTIVNVIRAIRSKAGDGPLAEFEHQLLLGAPAYPIRRKIPEAD